MDPLYGPPLIPLNKACCIHFRSFAWKPAIFMRCDNYTNCKEPSGSKHVVVLEDAAARAILVIVVLPSTQSRQKAPIWSPFIPHL